MDWYLEAGMPEGLSHLRHEVAAYLHRHARPDTDGEAGGEGESDVTAAELLFSEAVGNAVRHTSGGCWVSLTWTGEQPVLTVMDLGPGFDPTRLGADRRAADDPPDLLQESGRGLFLISLLAPEHRARARDGAGMLVSMTLPVRRRVSRSYDPPRHRTGVLPSLAEARPEGGFGRESFLRALVVQLAQTMETQQGPDAAEAAVAQVGVDVGGQMEQEFRAAERVVGRLTPEQLGQCYVRLKHAIDGDFSVLEATEERVVLVNRRCPFGTAVQRAPALCRMTSSVFGGIAARNSDDGASVVLEERIAVGDPGCRVVVHLTPPGPDVVPHAHRYAAPQDDRVEA